jgi:tRNA(Ile)-lysidine synthetase-like protein
MGPLSALEACPEEVLPSGSLLVVACSGGRDSMALCHALRATGRWRLHVVTVDHGLRPDSGADAAFVLAHAQALGLDGVVIGPAAANGFPPGEGPEDTARRLRHAALEAERRRMGATRVVYAHTADDQLETMLMRVARGAGAAGLGGMASLAGNRARPWLAVRRADVAAFAAEEGVPFRTDPTNVDPRFLRNRVRASLLPAFEAVFGPAGVEGALRTARHARTEAAALADAAASLPVDGPFLESGAATLLIPQATLVAATPATRRIAVHLWICLVYDAAGCARPRRMADRVDRVVAALEQGGGRIVAGRDGFSMRTEGQIVRLRVEQGAG